MNRKLIYAIMAIASMTAFYSCEDEDLEKVFDEKTSLDTSFLFSEDYQDTIVIGYDLPTPITDWLGMVKDDAKVCKLSIPGTHDTMTGIGFYQPLLKYVFNMTAISQVSTLEEQMACGIRFFDIRPVVSIDTLATDPAEKQILRLAHGISEIDVTLEETIPESSPVGVLHCQVAGRQRHGEPEQLDGAAQQGAEQAEVSRTVRRGLAARHHRG